MELYRLEDGRLKKFKGGFVVLNNRIYTNPTEDTVRSAGYKDLVYNDKPEYNEEEQYLNKVYTEYDTTIYVDYELMDMPQEEGVTNDD